MPPVSPRIEASKVTSWAGKLLRYQLFPMPKTLIVLRQSTLLRRRASGSQFPTSTAAFVDKHRAIKLGSRDDKPSIKRVRSSRRFKVHKVDLDGVQLGWPWPKVRL